MPIAAGGIWRHSATKVLHLVEALGLTTGPGAPELQVVFSPLFAPSRLRLIMPEPEWREKFESLDYLSAAHQGHGL